MISYGPNFFFPDSYAAPQYSPAEERQHEIEERLDENRADWVDDLEPDVDPTVDVCRHLEILAELLTTPGKDA